MKTISVKILSMLIALTTFSIYNGLSQTTTYLSGAGTNTATPQAGMPGGTSKSTFVGSGAGNGGGGNGGSIRNTFIGSLAGYNTTAFSANVGLGHKALFTLSGGAASDSTCNVAVGDYALYTNNPSTSNPATNGIKNSALGYKAFFSNTTGKYGTAVGYQALTSNVAADNNTAVGYQALGSASSAGDADITAVGYQSLANTSGTSKGGLTAIGSGSGFSNTTGANNTFSGYQSGYSNTTGAENTFSGYQSGYTNTASYNTFYGSLSGASNTSGANNAFLGFSSGNTNTTGHDNVFTGYQAGYLNTTGYVNTFVGSKSGYSNVSSRGNTYIGTQAGYSSTASYNTFTGSGCGYSNTSGASNTFLGESAGYYNTTASYNTFLGKIAGNTNTTGSNNTCVGYGADVNASNLTNATAIGNGAITTATNMMYLGNANALLYCAQGVWSGSDRRFKINITENVKGLEFIKKLRPVTYQMNTQALDNFIIQNMPDSIKTMHQAGMDFAPSTAIVHSGFIAQEVDSVAQLCNFISDIVHRPDNNSTHYALNYAEFVVPLVKAVQELSNKVDSLLAITNPAGTTKSMHNNSNQGENGTTQEIKLRLPVEILMSEARPNPNDGKAEIDYYLPSSVSNAKIIFTDMLGNVINEVQLTAGYGTIAVDTQDLPNGNYTFSLVTDGKVYSTKKMLRSK